MVISDSVDSTKKLHENYCFTIGWLLDSLRANDENYKKCHASKAVKNITSYDVSGGKGFMSIILRCTVFFVDSNDERYTTILKIPGFESMKEASDKSDYGEQDWITDDMKLSFADLHKYECEFYNEIAPLLDASIFPKIFKTESWILNEKDGCVHMEDLTSRGKSLSYFDCINLTQIKSFVRHLAHMHKNILSSDPILWKGKHFKGSEMFANALYMLEGAYEPFLKRCKREDDFRPLIEKYKKISMNREYYFYAINQSFIDLKMPSVLVHGDPHSGNILWSTNTDGDIENEISAIIDWQTMHEGSPMEDLARFLTHCTNGVVRRQAEEFIFDFYLECLKKEFDGDATKVPYTIEQLKKAYKFAFVIQTFFTISDLSFFLEAIDVSNEAIKAASYDMGVLKAWHNLEDCDKILQGELKEYFIKYGN